MKYDISDSKLSERKWVYLEVWTNIDGHFVFRTSNRQDWIKCRKRSWAIGGSRLTICVHVANWCHDLPAFTEESARELAIFFHDGKWTIERCNLRG